MENAEERDLEAREGVAAEIEGKDSGAEVVPEEHFSFKEDTDKVLHFIVTDDWENVLAALTKDMDPWDVDLITLSERFTSYLGKLQKRDLQAEGLQSREQAAAKRTDLRAPSRVILAAAIIYRLKSETLRQEEEESLETIEENIAEEEGETREPLSLPPIEVPLKREPKRKVSIRELVNALGKAMTVKDRREARRFFSMELKGIDITKKIEEVYSKIIAFLETAQAITFSSLFATKQKAPTAEEKLMHFNSILHLSTQERIVCSQDTLFGEIYITKAEVDHAAPQAP